MTLVFILTITDTANFDKVEHHSAWSTHAKAYEHAAKVTSALVLRDIDHGLGNTFNIGICMMEVNT